MYSNLRSFNTVIFVINRLKMIEVVINLSCYNLSNHFRDEEIQIGNGTNILKFVMVMVIVAM